MHAVRFLSEDPIITGPLVCHLCKDATFVYDADFAAHKQKSPLLGRTSTARECSSCLSTLEVVPLLVRRRESLFKIARTFSNSLGLARGPTPSRASQKSLGANCMCVVPVEGHH